MLAGTTFASCYPYSQHQHHGRGKGEGGAVGVESGEVSWVWKREAGCEHAGGCAGFGGSGSEGLSGDYSAGQERRFGQEGEELSLLSGWGPNTGSNHGGMRAGRDSFRLPAPQTGPYAGPVLNRDPLPHMLQCLFASIK